MEYVRFLIQNASIGRVVKLELENKMLKESIKAMEASVKAATKTATTALNRVDDLKKASKK